MSEGADRCPNERACPFNAMAGVTEIGLPDNLASPRIAGTLEARLPLRRKCAWMAQDVRMLVVATRALDRNQHV
jgi:hypothetical protein